MPPQALDAGGGGSQFSFAAPVAEEGGEGYGTWMQKVRGSYGYFSRASDQGGRRKGGAAGYRRGPSVEAGGEPKGVAGPAPVGRRLSPVLGEKARPLRLLPAVYPSSQSQQAMARYRREMVELVRGVPEAAYELSLRDLVEVPRAEAPREEEEAGKEKGGGPDQVAIAAGRDQKKGKEIKKSKSGKKLILRSASTDGGVFLLKLFFPPSLAWRRRSDSSGKGAKVSPKPMMAEGEKRRPEKEVDAERLQECGEMSNRDETKNSGRRKAIGCYPFSIKQKPHNPI